MRMRKILAGVLAAILLVGALVYIIIGRRSSAETTD